MSLVPTGALVEAARASGDAAVAFNVIGLEHAEGAVLGAELAERPVVLQVSANAITFRGAVEPLAAACAWLAADAEVPVALHLDHATDLDLCRQAAAAGFSSVMFDAASADYERNVALTRRAVEWAHESGVWCEAELGEVPGKPGAREGDVTDPEQASAYLAATGADALAVAVGSRHKMTEGSADLDLDLIGELREAVAVPLVLHGSSGVPLPHLREAVDAGIAKVNVGTRLALAFSGAVRTALAEAPDDPDPRQLLIPARAAIAAVVAETLTLLAPPLD